MNAEPERAARGARLKACGRAETTMLDRFEQGLVWINRWILIALLLAMACIIFANVVLRYTTGDSIIWAEEVARHMMIWVTFLGAGLVMRTGGHVAIDNLHTAVGPGAARVLRMLVAVGIALFCVFMAIASSDYVWRTRFQTTAATDIPISFIYAAMPVGFVLLLVHLLLIVRRYVLYGTYAAEEAMSSDADAAL